MAANQLRGTPGMLLLGFAVAMLIVAVWQWTQKHGRSDEKMSSPPGESVRAK